MLSAGETYNPWRLFVGCVIPNAILRCTELSSTAKLVFGKLCQFAGENGQAYPSYKTLGREVGVKQRQAMRAVQELMDFGLIHPINQNRPDGGSSSNVYEFLWHDIFIEGTFSHPGVKHDTGGSVINVTPSGCHNRHHRVSDLTPKENHRRDKKKEEKTNEQIRSLLSCTPFSEISDRGLNILIKRHGSERTTRVADIAAETWRRDRKEISNPIGYLQTLCESHVVPEWYELPEERNARLEAAAERKLSEARKLEEQLAAEERESQEREGFWLSLSEEDRQKYRDEARGASPIFHDLEGVPLDAIAKLIVWGNRP